MSNEVLKDSATSIGAEPPATHHWLLFWTGALLFLLGPALYFVQIQQKLLWMPWYVPILSTIGVGLIFMSVWRRRGFVRTAGLLFFAAFCGLQWFILAVAIKTPEYEGPGVAGQVVPDFETRLANGQPFDDHDLKNGVDSVLVFFRGRW